MSAPVEAFSLSPAAVGGRRGSKKKLKLVKKKTVRRMLKKLGMKMRGGADAAVVPEKAADAVAKLADAPAGGRRRHGKSHRRSRGKSLFGQLF